MALSRTRARVLVFALMAAALAAGGAVVWFQPQKLFLDSAERHRSGS